MQNSTRQAKKVIWPDSGHKKGEIIVCFKVKIDVDLVR